MLTLKTPNDMLSRKTRYAMLAMAALARSYGREQLSIRTIANAEHVPARVLEGILLRLKNNGLLTSSRGKSGGYTLAKRPEEISLLDIVLLFEESVSMLACVCVDDDYRPCDFCKDEKSCPIRSTFSAIYSQTAEILRKTMLSDLADNAEKPNLE